MLDHDEERQLAEIEARLRDEAPDLLELFEVIPDPTDRSDPTVDGGPSTSPSHRRRESFASRAPEPPPTRHPVLKSLAAVLLAVALTTVATFTVGPNVGGLVAVIGLSAAGMYAYQVLRGCPGLRDQHDGA